MTKHEDPILQAFSFDFTCIDPILLNNNHVILDHNEIRFYMACRIGSIYINLILIELEDTILQALGFNSICIDPILHVINHVISDPNKIRSYMACRIRSIYASPIFHPKWTSNFTRSNLTWPVESDLYMSVQFFIRNEHPILHS